MRVLSKAGLWRRRDGPVNFHHVRFLYAVEIVGGEERVEVDGSSDAFGWFSRDEMAGLDRVGLLDEALT